MSIFNLPDLGEGLHDAEIVEWRVTPGDQVEAGQTLVSVETDKAVVDIPSPHAGRIAQIHGEPGFHIEVGAPLVEFEDGTRDEPAALVGNLPVGDTVAQTADIKRAEPAPARIRATPAVRAKARSLGIDISAVTPTGRDGQVIAADLDHIATEDAAFVSTPLRGPRRAMALNMARAQSEVSPATVTDDAIVPQWTDETDMTILLVKAVAKAAGIVPALNAWFDGQALTLTQHNHVHVGVAVDTPEGLFVPVLRDADRSGVSELRHDLDRFKDEIATRTISHDDLRGPTITISNFGTLGGRYAALALLPPQVAILGAGAVADRVVAKDGKPVVCRTQPLSLTFDHRAVTGGEGARFLAAVKQYLEGSR
jgi:pyruvate dehydrogenase E2 component (dihydrolipoamide acetyltransferase)